MTTALGAEDKTGPQAQSPPGGPTNALGALVGEATRDYRAKNDHELNLKRGDSVLVTDASEDNGGWWYAAKGSEHGWVWSQFVNLRRPGENSVPRSQSFASPLPQKVHMPLCASTFRPGLTLCHERDFRWTLPVRSQCNMLVGAVHQTIEGDHRRRGRRGLPCHSYRPPTRRKMRAS